MIQFEKNYNYYRWLRAVKFKDEIKKLEEKPNILDVPHEFEINVAVSMKLDEIYNDAFLQTECGHNIAIAGPQIYLKKFEEYERSNATNDQ